jgi:hypothetical protein
MKPCTTACSSSIFKVFNLREAIDQIKHYDDFISDNLNYLVPFLKRYLDVEKYPLISANPILVEEYIDFPYKCCVDGCVSNGEIIIWGISDSHYFAQRPECCADFTLPSTLPHPMQNQLRQAYQKIVQRLITYGFNNQFINIEFFASAQGDLKVMEVNGRMAPVAAPLYRQCLNQGDPYTALIVMGIGHQPREPTPNGFVGGIFYITTLAQDKAKNLLDFEQTNHISNIEIRVDPEQEITGVGLNGFPLATVSLVGNSISRATGPG